MKKIMMQKLMTKGNDKLDKSILGWSITPVKSCLNCKDCKSSCYATKPYNRYPNVKIAWDRNFEMAKANNFSANIINQVERCRKQPVVRIHVSGDFFSQDYLNEWTKIVASCPDTIFYGYSKVMEILDFTELLKLPNVNIINSIASDGGINFGDADRVAELVELGYSVCPATQKKDVICGGNHKNSCTLCQTNDKVCFVKH